jgi:uncharacterized phage protein gp47/JayE
MPYNRPTLTALRAQVASDIAADLPGLDTLMRYSNLGVVGDVQAGLANGLHDHIDYAARQSVPVTARDEALAGWGALKGVYIKAATKAVLTVAFNATGTNPVPAGTQVTRSDGAVFEVNADASPSGSIISTTVTADVAGSAGSTAVGEVLYLSIGISGVAPSGTVTAIETEGADIESQDDFLSRVIQAYQTTPAGGSTPDYVDWALAVTGVTRAWCVPRGYGAGTVVVLFMMDSVRAAEGGFPQGTNGLATSDTRDAAATGDQLVVANALALEQPADPRVYLMAPGQNAVNFTIAGLTPTDATKTAISTAISTALKTYGTAGGTTDMDKINAALASVSAASGAVITAMSCNAGSIVPGPIGNIVSNALTLPVLGDISYL